MLIKAFLLLLFRNSPQTGARMNATPITPFSAQKREQRYITYGKLTREACRRMYQECKKICTGRHTKICPWPSVSKQRTHVANKNSVKGITKNCKLPVAHASYTENGHVNTNIQTRTTPKGIVKYKARVTCNTLANNMFTVKPPRVTTYKRKTCTSLLTRAAQACASNAQNRRATSKAYKNIRRSNRTPFELRTETRRSFLGNIKNVKNTPKTPCYTCATLSKANGANTNKGIEVTMGNPRKGRQMFLSLLAVFGVIQAVSKAVKDLINAAIKGEISYAG